MHGPLGGRRLHLYRDAVNRDPDKPVPFRLYVAAVNLAFIWGLVVGVILEWSPGVKWWELAIVVAALLLLVAWSDRGRR